MKESVYKVLIVEDSEINLQSMNRQLQKHHALVDLARNGKEAKAAIVNNYFDVVILDIELPDIDGITLCKWLRECGFDKPIIAVTAHKELQDIAFRAGFDAYLTKPYTRHEIVDKIQIAILARRKERVKLQCQASSLHYTSQHS